MLKLEERSHKKVFALIRAQGHVSGASLSKQTDMQPSSLVYILRNLKEKQLIVVDGYGASTLKGGKKPLLWKANPDCCNIMGLDVTGRAIRAVMVNLSGDIIIKVQKEFVPGSAEKIISRIIKTISEVNAESGQKIQKLAYIAVSIPGVVNPHTHHIINSDELKLHNFDLKSRIFEEFKIPVGIINDANSGALCEKWFNKNDFSTQNLLYMMYSPLAGGLGLGVLLKRKLYTGSNGIAGEFASHLQPIEQIVMRIRETIPQDQILIPVGATTIQISDLYAYMKRGCKLSAKVLKELSHQIAMELRNITNLFDPEKIILGGELSVCENYCCNEIEVLLKELYKKYEPYKINIPVVEYASQKSFSAAIGATALYLIQELST
jgi:predicted NBD/HSP70 family sugar kinase